VVGVPAREVKDVADSGTLGSWKVPALASKIVPLGDIAASR